MVCHFLFKGARMQFWQCFQCIKWLDPSQIMACIISAIYLFCVFLVFFEKCVLDCIMLQIWFFCMLYMLWYTIVVVNSLYTFSPPLFLQYSIVYKTLSWYFDALNFYIFPCFSQGGLDLSNFYVVSNHNFLVQRILEKKTQLHID